jgi:chemotaxis protein CheD
MNLIVVDKDQISVSSQLQDALVSYGVESGIVVAFYDPTVQVGGLLRFTEPDSRSDAERARAIPGRYADSGIAALFDGVSRLGAAKPRLTVRLAGGSERSTPGSNCGGPRAAAKKNYLAIRKNLWKLGVFVHSEDVGGESTRNVRLEIESGRFWACEMGSEGRLLKECVLEGVSHCPTGS